MEEERIQSITNRFLQFQEEKKKNKRIRFIIRFLIFVVLITLASLLYMQSRSFNSQNMKYQLQKELVNLQPMITEETIKIVKEVYPVYVAEFQKQIEDNQEKLSALVDTEASVFLRIAEHDVTKGIQEGYLKLLEKQKQHLYEEFPTLRDKQKAEKAIDNIIKHGGPKLQSIVEKKFQKHSNLLIHISEKLKVLEDSKFQKDDKLAQKTLGITLELIGKKMQSSAYEEDK